MKKRQWSVWLNSWWLSKWLWNVDQVLVQCWNNDENINVLKWPVWGGYIIVLRWILNRLWDVDWAIMNLGCWWMVVSVLRRIYYCILLDVIVTNGCISIMKDLLLYFIEYNCEEWLYEYYERSIVVLYCTLIVMNGWMSNTKGVLLWYWMLNCYGMFVCVMKDLLLCLLNVKLLWNACTSITKGLLLCCSECQVVMNCLKEQFKGYYYVIVIS